MRNYCAHFQFPDWLAKLSKRNISMYNSTLLARKVNWQWHFCFSARYTVRRISDRIATKCKTTWLEWWLNTRCRNTASISIHGSEPLDTHTLLRSLFLKINDNFAGLSKELNSSFSLPKNIGCSFVLDCLSDILGVLEIKSKKQFRQVRKYL